MGMTARDLVVHMGELRGLPRRVAVLRASEVLFQVGLEEERSRLIRTFSVGMRQRTNLAQAIVHSPAMVILDEPTNGLDPAGREEMLTLVRRLSADLGIAVIMSSHVLEDVARTCDSVLVMRDGKIVATQRLAQADRVDNGEVQVQIVGDAGRVRRGRRGAGAGRAAGRRVAAGAGRRRRRGAARRARRRRRERRRAARAAAGRAHPRAVADRSDRMSTDARLVDTAFTTLPGTARRTAGRDLVARALERAARARRPPRLEGQADPDLADAARVRAGARGAGPARASSARAASAARSPTPLPYSDYISTIAIVILVFSVVITPELVCPDRRDRTLSLYFSTAIGRLDYVLGKVAAALMPLLLVTLAPVLLLYVGTVLFAVHPVGYLQAHWLDLPRIIASGLIVATFYGLVGLAISSLTSRRAFAVGGYLAFLAISTMMGGVLSHALNERYFRLLAVAAAPIRAGQGLFPKYSDPGNISPVVWGSTVVEVCVVAVIVLAVRYGRDEG